MEGATQTALPVPETLVPSARSRWLARLMRLFVRPFAAILPANRLGVRLARLWMRVVMWTFGVPRGIRVEPVSERFEGEAVAGEWVTARGVEPDGAVMLYLHGSGYSVCSTRTHRGLIARLSAACGMPVFALEYRLAPEHPFPCAADDTLAAYRWLLEQSYDPERIVVAGDSAGGHLTIALAVELCSKELPLPAGLLLLSPLVDPTFELSAARDRECRDPMFTVACGRRLVGLYTGAADPADVRLALMCCDASGLPPMLLQAGGLEMLSADAEAFAKLVNDAGGSCELQVWPGQVHVFQALSHVLPEARAALGHAGRFVRGVTAPAGEPTQVT